MLQLLHKTQRLRWVHLNPNRPFSKSNMRLWIIKPVPTGASSYLGFNQLCFRDKSVLYLQISPFTCSQITHIPLGLPVVCSCVRAAAEGLFIALQYDFHQDLSSCHVFLSRESNANLGWRIKLTQLWDCRGQDSPLLAALSHHSA